MDELEIVDHRQVEGLSIFLNTVDHRTAHVHPEWELDWVLEGELAVTGGQGEFRVSWGQLVLFGPNAPHEFHKAGEKCTILCFQIAPERLPDSRPMVVEGGTPENFLTERELDWVRNTLADTARAYFAGEEHYGLLCLVLHKLLSRLPCRVLTPEEAASRDRRNARLNRLIRFVEENYTHKIRLGDFAAAEGCSLSYLSHFIKDATNQTFQDYVQSVRFQSACRRIAAGEDRMLEVCMASGFSDYRYFSRAFQEQFGMTPEAYSRQTRRTRREPAQARPSLHSVERIYSRQESLALLDTLLSR